MHDDGFFGEKVAATYDQDCAGAFAEAEIEATATFLARLAGSGRALELGIGTGRIAVPLSTRGVPVRGIELSQAMATRLLEKSDSIGVTIGDFSTTRVDGEFKLAYLVFNTIMNLTTQAAQVACFRNVADHLVVGGHFAIECLLPDLQRLPFGETIRPFSVTETHLGFDEYDVVRQGQVSHHFSLRNGAWVRNSMPFRYVWPSELDLMAEMAGMSLVERWSGWNRERFTNLSQKHVSIWRKDR